MFVLESCMRIITPDNDSVIKNTLYTPGDVCGYAIIGIYINVGTALFGSATQGFVPVIRARKLLPGWYC